MGYDPSATRGDSTTLHLKTDYRDRIHYNRLPLDRNLVPSQLLDNLNYHWPVHYCFMHQGKRDVETVLTMGIMEDVSIIPQPADTGKVDLVMNVVERPSGGFSAGGGISSGITSGPLRGLIGR
ncbi:hypothetical protein RYX36_035523 [Vicia faba]